MATITKHLGKKTLSYKVRIRRKGHSTITATFPNLATAKQFASKYDDSMRAGKYLEKKESRKHLISEAIQRYISENQLNNLQTKKDREAQLRTIEKIIGNRFFSDLLNPATISFLESELLKRKNQKAGTLSVATANRYLSALSHLCQIAHSKWYWIDRNPLRQFQRNTEKPKGGRALTQDEFETLSNYCLNNQNQKIAAVIILALCTGMRKNEIRFLKWQDIDLKSEQISIKNSKNGEPRTLPLTEPALSIIKNYSKVRLLNSDWVFPSLTCNSPFKIDEPWREILGITGITNFRFHDLRHTCASFLAANNVNARIIAQILGHKTIAMAMKYQHLSTSQVRPFLDLTITNAFQSISSKKGII